MAVTHIDYRKHPTINALVFKESWAKVPASLWAMIVASYTEFPGMTPEETRATVGFINPAGAGIAEDELLVGPIICERSSKNKNSGSLYITPAVSLEVAARVARTDPHCHGEYTNVYFLWENDRLVLTVR